MSEIILPHRWRQQPSGPVRLAGEWDGRFISLCAANLAGFDPRSGLLLSADTVRPSIGYSREGPAFVGNGSTTGLTHALTTTRFITAPFSVIGVGVSSNASGSQTFLNAGNAASFAAILRLDGTTLSFYLQTAAVGALQIASAASAGGLVVAVATYDGVSAMSLYTRNKPKATASFASGTNWSITGVNYLEGNRGAKEAWDGPVNMAGFINGCLTDAEARSLVDNPWQIFRPLTRRVWVSVGGASYALPVSAASASIAGNTVGLRADRRLAVQSASETITGQAVGLRIARRMAASAASLAINGQPVAMLWSGGAKTLTVTPGAWSIAGGAVGLRVSRRMIAQPAAFQVTGQAVTVTYSGGVVAETFARRTGAYTNLQTSTRQANISTATRRTPS